VIEERIFNNRYRLDRKLGEGGMATVFCATDTVLRRRVAVKVLRDQYAADAEFVRRFYQEAESAARLSHPNIVNTYDVGREGDTYYIVMELVDGASLAEIIAADGKLPEPVAIDYGAQIASGLAYAHRAGLLHRDIKPANILVTKDDVVKLSDFGIARAVSEQTMTLTRPGLVMGSVYYISPEQAQGFELHETSDLYSLGVVLYQMLVGSLPFTGESPVTVALKHIGDPVPRLDTRELGVSPALGAIVNRLLQKNPENRFQSASELATALREARERPSVAAYRISNDAAEATARARGQRLPPRRSPMPDRQERRYTTAGDEPQSSPFRGVAIAALLIVFLAAATFGGYLLFGRPLPNLAATIPVGNYVGMSSAQAQRAALDAGLMPRFLKTASDTVPADHVIRQNPDPGTSAAKDAIVELFVSNGLPPVGVPDVRDTTMLDAERYLQQDEKFNVKIVRKFNPAAKDTVIDQQPKPSAQVKPGSTITLTVSDGPAPVSVPNFVNMQVSAAQDLAQRSGISLDATEASVNGVPANTVASQDVPAGSKVTASTTVHVVVSTGVQSVPSTVQGAATTVPGVVGKAYQDAITALQKAGFNVNVAYSVSATNNATIVSQDPAANTNAPQGSAVTITLSVPGQIPDTDGMTPAAAQATLLAAGYSVGKTQYTSSAGQGGKVIGTDPAVGTDLPPGSSVTLIVNGPP
jgi:serine/threonine-protein kinase